MSRKTALQEAAVQAIELEAFRDGILDLYLRCGRKKDYIDIEGHVVPDVKELPDERPLDKDLP